MTWLLLIAIVLSVVWTGLCMLSYYQCRRHPSPFMSWNVNDTLWMVFGYAVIWGCAGIIHFAVKYW